MGIMNMSGSMKYGPNGKRRKTNAWKQKKRHAITESKKTFDRAYPEGYKEQVIIPSHTSTRGSGAGTGPDLEWEKEKQEISKQYTIAPAYNKGAYQVIGKNNIKDIGK
jgi:hypothetical protein